MQIGYCTNVHAGADLDQVLANLRRFAVPVRRQFCPDEPLGVGLWLSASAARNLLADNRLAEVADWLKENGLLPFTLNGFPFGDFHQEVVKHRVYLPAWFESARADYTRDLIAILHGLLPAGLEGSISTLPIAWAAPAATPQRLQVTASALASLAEQLVTLEQTTGRCIHLDLEPEPGCVLQRSSDVVRFFEEYLLPGRDEHLMRRHVRVCHDICHAAVMFENQADALQRYRSAGIGIGKIQVSSAVALDLDKTAPAERSQALQQLAGFCEPRYLHQTVVRTQDGSAEFYDDLDQALTACQTRPETSTAAWRVHFHVPIYVECFGRLEATQGAIRECLRLAQTHNLTQHFEVETYAWGVLPAELQQPDLSAGIAEEMRWLRAVM